MTELQTINNILANNHNILWRDRQKPRVFKGIKYLHCIGCKRIFNFDTKETIYWFNAHGWVICNECMNIYGTKRGDSNDRGPIR